MHSDEKRMQARSRQAQEELKEMFERGVEDNV
jgi:hypothetical protein